MSKSNISFSQSDVARKAEIIQVLIIVKKNQSFSSEYTDNLKVKSLFGNSNIAQSCKEGSTKIKYILQFGIAPYIKENFKQNLKVRTMLLNLTKPQHK